MKRESLTLHPALLRLLQLASPTLPIGTYAYSQGMEFAVTHGWIHDQASAQRWILGLLRHSLANLDVPVLVRLYDAWQSADEIRAEHWSRFLHASRESAELQAEDRQMGTALARLLAELGIPEAGAWQARPETTLAALFTLAASHWAIPVEHTAAGYLWAWADNQVAAAIKLIPLGQTAGQQILGEVVRVIPEVVAHGVRCDDKSIGFTAPALGIASALHETQYSRLFRS